MQVTLGRAEVVVAASEPFFCPDWLPAVLLATFETAIGTVVAGIVFMTAAVAGPRLGAADFWAWAVVNGIVAMHPIMTSTHILSRIVFLLPLIRPGNMVSVFASLFQLIRNIFTSSTFCSRAFRPAINSADHVPVVGGISY